MLKKHKPNKELIEYFRDTANDASVVRLPLLVAIKVLLALMVTGAGYPMLVILLIPTLMMYIRLARITTDQANTKLHQVYNGLPREEDDSKWATRIGKLYNRITTLDFVVSIVVVVILLIIS